MYRRKPKSLTGSKIPLTSSNRGSDISPPNNTSLIVQRSRISEELEEDLPKSVTALLFDDDDDTDSIDLCRPSTSVLNSMSQKKQSTPKKNPKQVLRESNVIQSKSRSTSSSDSSFLPKSKSYGSSPKKSKNSFFLSILSECGTEEIDGEGSYQLSKDQAVFSRKLDDKLKEDGIIEKFIISLKEYIDNDEKMMKLLMLTQTSSNCDVARGPVQEPMLRLLLMVDCLQPQLLELLLDRFSSIVNRSNAADNINLIGGILRQLRCLSRVQDTKFGSKLFDLMDVAPIEVQREIIFLLPELIIEDEFEVCSKQLAELVHGGTELTPIIIDSLGSLPLSSSLRSQVRQELLSRLDKYPKHFLPNIVQFLLNNIDPGNMTSIILALRLNLPLTQEQKDAHTSTQTGKRKANSDSYLNKTFETIKDALMVSKQLTDAWIKLINGLSSHDEFRPIDLMVITLIHGFVLGRKIPILSLIKSRIRAGILLDTHVTQTFQILRLVINNNNKEVLDLASSLLKSFEHSIAEMAICLYQEMFANCGPFLRQDIVSDLVMHLTTGTPHAARNALTLLMRIRDTDRPALEEHASSFMSALRVIPDVDLAMARQLSDFVASLVTARSQQDSGLVEEFSIFIRKQMSAWQQDTQQRGVVAAVMAVKHAILNKSEESSQEALECNFLLKMASGTTNACPVRRGFFFDELGSMLRETDERPAFLMAWADRIYNQAIEHIFAKDIDLECEHFPMTLQYSIENMDSLVLPIVGFATKSESDTYLSHLTIPAALRLLWCAEKDLSRINGMMGAAVILPDASVFEKFLSFQPFQQKIIMDCLFLCANFFIECVNALSTQKSSTMLIIRLKQLIEVRNLIVEHVHQIPEYVPPICQFHTPISKPVYKKPAAEGGKKTARGKKRKSDGTQAASQMNMDASVLPATWTAAPAEAMAQAPAADSTADLNVYVGSFRELHCHAYKLLRMELKLNPTKVFKKKKMSDLMVADVSWSYRPEDKPELGPADTLYLLQDYLQKADQILRERPWFLTRKPMGIVTETISATTFISGSIKLLPKLCLKLDVVSSYCKDLLEANDGIWDAPGCFPKHSTQIKLCFTALLQIIADILSWRGFQSPAHKNSLKEILFILARKSAPCSTQSSGPLALEAARFLSGLSGSLPLLSGGVSLTRAVQACVQYSGYKDFSLVGDLCGQLLQRPWFTVTGALDRGVAYNQQIDSLVRMHLACAGDKLATVEKLAEMSTDEVPSLLNKDSQLTTFPALNKGNFPLLYRALCEALVTAAGEELSHQQNDENIIAIWAKVTRTLIMLVDVAKIHTSRTNLKALLKRSQLIIQQFLSKGLPVMESALRVKSDEVLKVLKSLQSVTRFLHSVCCHSKINSDMAVSAHVPNIRALCERLTLEVKGMLLLNKIPLDCITIAVLKNRDIQGNDIMSQSSMTPSDDESEIPAEQEDEASADIDMDIPAAEDNDLISD